MEERRVRIGSLFEWLAAAAAVILVMWGISSPVQRLLGSRLPAVFGPASLDRNTPPDVPPGAMVVPVMLLMDGREIRQGDLHSRLEEILPSTLADGPPHVTRARFGDRHTRTYVLHGTRFYIVCEKLEPDGPMKVSGIYLP